MPEVAAAQVLTLLQLGNYEAAAGLAAKYGLPLSQARVQMAKGEPASALAVLKQVLQEAEAKDWPDRRLEALVLQALAYQAHGDREQAMQTLAEALALGEAGDFIRIFVDEGPPMAVLLQGVAKRGDDSAYLRKLLGAFGKNEVKTPVSTILVEPLTGRELDVLRLLATYLTGPEIARELMVSLNTMRTHTKNIYNKLGVNNRQEAVRRAKELELL